jgi:Type I restriction enzyme R protein N terminus (HSDR_N)
VSAAMPVPTPQVTPVGSVPEGKVADFLTGTFVNDTPEEYVRQNIEKALVRQYKYAPADCAPEFSIKVGSSRRRVDMVVSHDIRRPWPTRSRPQRGMWGNMSRAILLSGWCRRAGHQPLR